MSAAGGTAVSPAHFVPDSLMESAEVSRIFLQVADASSWDWDEDEVVGRIVPKSSPLPRRRTSESSDDSEPEAPSARPRRVSFADAFGLSLVSVKEFDSRDVSGPPGADAPEASGRDAEEYFLSSVFTVPSTADELARKLEEQKCELECIELLPGTTTLRGVVRVLNLCYSKAVYVRTTLDSWGTHFDLLSEFIPGSSDGETDRFLFRLTLVPPFQKEGAKVEFCLRYETSVGTFWANNSGMNYVVFCHQRAVKDAKEKQLGDGDRNNTIKKSCLKPRSKYLDSSEDNPAEGTLIIVPAETPDISTQKQEVVVGKALENTLPQSDVPRGDDRQKSLVDSNCNYSWRSRRRAARLARMQNQFYQKGTDAQQGDSATQGEEVRHAETLSEISMLPYWEPTTSPPGVCNRNQINSAEEKPTRDQIPPPPLESDRGRVAPVLPLTNDSRNGGTSGMQCVNQQEEDAVPNLAEGEIPAAGHRESWDSFGEVKHTAAREEAVPKSPLFDSAIPLVDAIVMQSDSIGGATATYGNAGNPLVSEGDIDARGCIGADVTGEAERGQWESSPSRVTAGTRLTVQSDRGENPFCQHTHDFKLDTPSHYHTLTEGQDIAKGSEREALASDGMNSKGMTIHSSQLSETADGRPQLPLGGFLALADRLQSPNEIPLSDTSAPKQKDPDSTLDKDVVHSSQSTSPVEAEGPRKDDTAEHVGGHKSAFLTNAVELISAEKHTLTGAGDMTLTLELLNDKEAEKSAHERVTSCRSFVSMFRGRGSKVTDEDKTIFRERNDRADEVSMENTDIEEHEEEESNRHKESFHDEIEGDVSFQKENLNEEEKGLPSENETDFHGEEQVFMENEDLYYEEDILMENEDLYDKEDMPTENEDLYEEEAVLMENEDNLYDEEETAIMEMECDFDCVQEEACLVEEDLDEEKEEELAQKEEHLHHEDANFLKCPGQAEENLLLEIEEVSEKKSDAVMESDSTLYKKEEEDAFQEEEVYGHRETFPSKKEEHINEGAEHGQPRKGHDMDKYLNRRGVEDSPTTELTAEGDTEPNTDRVKGVLKHQVTQTSAGDKRNSSRSESPSVSKVSPLTKESLYQQGEAREKSSSFRVDLGSVEEPGYHTTVRLPVEKVNNVGRNYLFWWRDFFPFGHMSRSFLYALLCVVFIFTAFYYDFLPCFALYVLSVYWLYFHGEKQRLQGTDGTEWSGAAHNRTGQVKS